MSNEEEIWKTYPEIPFIEASNLGRVRTKDRIVMRKDGSKLPIKGRILKQQLLPGGYMFVNFRVNGKRVCLLVHRAVAKSFIPNPNNYPEVNHKDNDRANNRLDNLEWCSRQYNSDYKKNFGTSQAEVLGTPVIATNTETSEVFWFESQCEAARKLGVFQPSISAVIKGRLNKTGDFWFCNADENAVEKVRSKFGDEIAEKVEKLINEKYN